MLARAREYQPALHALLMTEEMFVRYRDRHAMPERTPADDSLPNGLGATEQAPYLKLLEAKACYMAI
ncbi:MAG: Wadjet anti-phage system protein JetD domain-containing protein [Gammaproteobacteria bacterium]